MPGAWVGRELRRLLRPGDHRRRRRPPPHALRTVPLARTLRPAGHRPRHRVESARRSHPARLPALRKAVRRHGRQHDHLSAALGHTGRREGPRIRPRAGRSVGRVRQPARARGSPAGRGRARAWSAGLRRRPAPPRSRLHLRGGGGADPAGRRGDGFAPAGASPAPGRPPGRHGPVRPARRRRLPGLVGGHARTDRAPVGQGRLRRSRTGEIRPPRARDAHRPADRLRPAGGSGGERRRRKAPGPVQPAPGGPARLRPAPSRGHGGGLPGRVAGADGRPAATAPGMPLRRRHPGGAHPARPHPGRRRHPLHQPPPRPRSRDLPASPGTPRPGEDSGSPPLPGAVHADRHRRRRLQPGAGRPAAQGDERQTLPQAHAGPESRAHGRHGGQRSRRGDGGGDLRQTPRLRRIRLPRVARLLLRLPGLRLGLVEGPPSRALLRGDPRRAADGLLLSPVPGGRRPAPRGEDRPARRDAIGGEGPGASRRP